MRPRILLSAAMLALASVPSWAQGTWTAKANFGGGVRNFGIGFSIGHKGYMGLGQTSLGNTAAQQDLWEYDVVANTWTQKANFPGGVRTKATAFAVGTKAYVGLGVDATSVPKNDLWQYDPATNTWLQRVNIGGVARSVAAAFTVGNFGYVCGGNSGTALLADTWRYDPSLNQWTQRTNFGGGVRQSAVAFVVNGFGYVGTGAVTNGTRKKDFWRFTPATNTWLQVADFGGTERISAVGFTVGNSGYVATGLDIGALQKKDIWRYDPGTNTWSPQADAPQTIYNSACFAVAGKGYVVGGLHNSSSVADLYEYTPASTQGAANTWTRKANFGGFGGGFRHDAVAFSIGSKGYIGIGGPFPYKKDFWEFDPATNSWSQKADAGTQARFGATGFSIGAKGYIVGGRAFDQQFEFTFLTNSVLEYDPATNTWTGKAPFTGPSRSDAAGFSIGTKGYLGTGSGFGGGLTDFWEFDPTANTWTQKSSFPGPARLAAVGFSIGNKGYIGTGIGPNSAELADFWEYDPVLNSWSVKANFGGTPRAEAVGFGIGAKGYIGTGGAPSNVSDFWEYDPATNAWTQRADFLVSGSQDVGFSIGSKGYIGTNFFGEYDPGPVVNCSANQVTLTLNTDVFSSETRWEIAPSGNPNPVCNGSGYASNSTINVTCCLANGCYDLRVFDSFGDGILSPGGYILKDASNQRIVDNNGNGSTFTTLSQVTNGNSTPWSFCVPLGPDALVASSCDQVFALNSTVTVQVQENAAVTAQLTASPATSGYQICIFDPNGGFRRNVFLSFSVPGAAFPVGTSNALKPTFFNLNFSQAPFLPLNKLLNVRVRGKVNGVFLNCGPACRLVLGTPPCTTTKLTTTASPQISCGAQNVSVNGGQLFCDLVPGANRYKFQFAGPNNYLRNVSAPAAAVNSQAARTLTLANFQQQPLPCGVPLTVRVQASFDGGVTFCPFGPDCSISVTGCPVVQQRTLEGYASATGVSIWPNPSNGQELHLSIAMLPEAVENITVDVLDLTGKKVAARTLRAQGSSVNTVFDLGGLSQGAYVVSITAGEQHFMERMVVE